MKTAVLHGRELEAPTYRFCATVAINRTRGGTGTTRARAVWVDDRLQRFLIVGGDVCPEEENES